MIGNSVHVMRIALGDIVEEMGKPVDGKSQTAGAMGKKGSASSKARGRAGGEGGRTGWR